MPLAPGGAARSLKSEMTAPATDRMHLELDLPKDMAGLMAPLSLEFYGLALYNASKYTFEEVRIMGVIQIILGLAGVWFIRYGLLIWALGFGVVHIIYGIYIHYKYKR